MRHSAALHHVEHAERNRRCHLYRPRIGRHLCTSICTSQILASIAQCLQINVLHMN